MQYYNVNKNSLDDVIGPISEKRLVVIAHRFRWGEEKLLADLIFHYDSLGQRIELWNLNDSEWPVVDPRIFNCSVKMHKVIRDNLYKTGMVRTKRVLSEIADADDSSVIIVCGIQEMQYYPFDRTEMKGLIEKIKNIALTRDKPIILFSYITQIGRHEGEPIRVLTLDELDRIGISEDDAVIIHLENLYQAPKTGPFFCIGNSLLADKAELYESQEQAGKLDNPLSHEKLFDRNYRSIQRYVSRKQADIDDNPLFHEALPDRKLDYTDFPRGRVVWDISREISIVYIDPRIKNRIDEIAKRFSLSEYVVEEKTGNGML